LTTFELDASVGCAVVLAHVAVACASTALTPIVSPGRLIFGCEMLASEDTDGGAAFVYVVLARTASAVIGPIVVGLTVSALWLLVHGVPFTFARTGSTVATGGVPNVTTRAALARQMN
jgi:hypothetical protein